MSVTMEQDQKWSLSKRFLLRFIFIYIFLYIVPYGFEYIYNLDVLNPTGSSIWTSIVPKFGEIFLGISYNPNRLMSGFDSKFDYTRFLLIAILAIIFSFIWLFIDAKFKWNYDNKLKTLLRAILRYHVAFTLILYGMAKVFPLQFGIIGIDRLELKVGDFSPMGFLWVFMSYSQFYTFMTGLIEVIGGFLLLFRTTTLIGALICFTAMVNVVLLDIGYDVSVKLFAIHLLLMVMILLADDFKRIVDFLILNKPTSPKKYPALISNERFKTYGYVVKYVLIIYFIVTTAIHTGERLNNEHDQSNALLRKFYKVEEFVMNGDTLAPLLTDTLRWKNFSIGGLSARPNDILVSTMDNKKTRFTYKADTVKKTLEFHPLRDSTNKYLMQYEFISSEEFILYGKHNDDSIWMRTKTKNRDDYPLTRRGIRWIRDLE